MECKMSKKIFDMGRDIHKLQGEIKPLDVPTLSWEGIERFDPRIERMFGLPHHLLEGGKPRTVAIILGIRTTRLLNATPI